MARCLGSTMGKLKEAVVHVGRKTGGVYLRAKVSININRPLPLSVTASHEDRSKGLFKVSVYYEKLPLFCFCCGVLGHTSAHCDLKDTMNGNDLPYGKHILAFDKGPSVDEHTLRKKIAHFSWNCHDTERAGDSHARNTSGLQRLSLGADLLRQLILFAMPGVSSSSPTDPNPCKRGLLEEGEIPPASKVLCVEDTAGVQPTAIDTIQVEETGLARSQSQI
ncbi:unnamed protein product [Linum trigynum]|uniref:Zinc knuckle CX2CX4HX4C domain-containing protein n=1 Tax=Linum trigynum TaxID=586398 RepID=A0AAV2E2R8_9ROSI